MMHSFGGNARKSLYEMMYVTSQGQVLLQFLLVNPVMIART